jgi:hypothetical protein
MDDDLLIREAIRQRHLRRSGRSLAGTLALAVFFGAIGYTLVFHPGVISANVPYSGAAVAPVLVAVGGVACLIAVLFILGAVGGARPQAPWGDPVSGDCPTCGKQALRQDEEVVREAGGLATTARGTVTLCQTPGCDYAAAEVAAPGRLSRPASYHLPAHRDPSPETAPCRRCRQRPRRSWVA